MAKITEDQFNEEIREDKERAREFGLPFMLPSSWSELYDVKFSDSLWLVNNLIPSSGLSIISAPPRSYKTWVLFSIAIAVSEGSMLFDQFVTRQTNVLIIDEESGYSRVQKRIKQLGGKQDLPIYVSSLREFKLVDAHVNHVIKWCRLKKVNLVIIDSLVRVHSLDENAASQMSQAFNIAKRLASEGISVLFAHHNRKQSRQSEGSDPANDMRGSGDILAAVDTHLSIKRQDHEVTIIQTKSRDTEEYPEIKIELVKDGELLSFRYLGIDTDRQNRRPPLKEQVLAYLKDNPASPYLYIYTAITQEVGRVGDKTLRQLVRTMVHEKEILEINIGGNKKAYSLNINTALGLVT